jgi:hypothetical protein
LQEHFQRIVREVRIHRNALKLHFFTQGRIRSAVTGIPARASQNALQSQQKIASPPLHSPVGHDPEMTTWRSSWDGWQRHGSDAIKSMNMSDILRCCSATRISHQSRSRGLTPSARCHCASESPSDIHMFPMVPDGGLRGESRSPDISILRSTRG